MNIALCWFNSYLQSRQYCVKVNDTLSAATNLHMGVPQGSIIEPILFIMHTKDRNFSKKHGMSIHLYADDT